MNHYFSNGYVEFPRDFNSLDEVIRHCDDKGFLYRFKIPYDVGERDLPLAHKLSHCDRQLSSWVAFHDSHQEQSLYCFTNLSDATYAQMLR
jgi:hypothetical protein